MADLAFVEVLRQSTGCEGTPEEYEVRSSISHARPHSLAATVCSGLLSHMHFISRGCSMFKDLARIEHDTPSRSSTLG